MKQSAYRRAGVLVLLALATGWWPISVVATISVWWAATTGRIDFEDLYLAVFFPVVLLAAHLTL